jgi:thiamine biosynthesis lipoprotein
MQTTSDRFTLATLAVLVLVSCAGSRRAEVEVTVEGKALAVQVLGAEDGKAATALINSLQPLGVEAFASLAGSGSSDFAGVNALAGSRSGSLSQQNYDLLMRCFSYKKDTDEGFEFLIGPLRQAWGLPGNPRLPGQAEIDTARVLVREGGTFVVDKGVLLSRTGMAIDLHHVATGAVADRLAQVLRTGGHKDFLLRLGHVAVSGEQGPDGGYFTLPLDHPSESGRVLGSFKLRNLCLAVASVADEAFEIDGTAYHGHLDPGTGLPARGLLAVAVVCREGERADALASGLFVLGAEKGLAKASSLDDVEAVFVVDAGGKPELRLTPGMEAWFEAR